MPPPLLPQTRGGKRERDDGYPCPSTGAIIAPGVCRSNAFFVEYQRRFTHEQHETALVFLISDWLMQAQISGSRCQNQVARGIGRNPFGAAELQPDQCRLCTRSNYKIKFQLLLCAMECQINARINVTISNSLVLWNIGLPFSRIFADEVVANAGQILVARDLGMRIRSRDLHADHGALVRSPRPHR